MIVLLKKKKFIKKFKYFKELSILGVFKSFGIKKSNENLYYNYYLSYYSNISYSVSINFLIKSIRKIYPLVSLLFLKPNKFFFVNVDKLGGEDLSKIIQEIMESIRAYFIYDWGFGSLTNFRRIYYNFFLTERPLFYDLPTVVFFLRVLEKQHFIVPEAQRIGALSIGPINYESSSCIDYPIPMNSSMDYSYFFIRLILYFLNTNLIKSNFIKNYSKNEFEIWDVKRKTDKIFKDKIKKL